MLASERKFEGEGGKGLGCGSNRNLGAHLTLIPSDSMQEDVYKSSFFRFTELTDVIIVDIVYFQQCESKIIKNKVSYVNFQTRF